MNFLKEIPEHELRQTITNELHARPYRSLAPSCSIFFFAKYTGAGKKQDKLAFTALQKFCIAYEIPCPSSHCKHFVADLADFQFKWERHSEFTTYSAIKHNINHILFSATPPSEIIDFLSESEGKLLCATHLCIHNASDKYTQQDILSCFKKSSTVTAKIASNEAQVWTDLRLQPDGFNHILLLNQALKPMKMGRVAQRLLDVNVYRHLALLTFPIAQAFAPQLADIDKKLTQLLNQMNNEQESTEENDIRLLKEIIKNYEPPSAYPIKDARNCRRFICCRNKLLLNWLNWLWSQKYQIFWYKNQSRTSVRSGNNTHRLVGCNTC